MIVNASFLNEIIGRPGRGDVNIYNFCNLSLMDLSQENIVKHL